MKTMVVTAKDATPRVVSPTILTTRTGTNTVTVIVNVM